MGCICNYPLINYNILTGAQLKDYYLRIPFHIILM